MYSLPGVDSVSGGGYQPHVLILTNISGPLPPCSWYPQDGFTAEPLGCLLQATLSQAPRALQLESQNHRMVEVGWDLIDHLVIAKRCGELRSPMHMVLLSCDPSLLFLLSHEKQSGLNFENAYLGKKCICWEK